MSAIGNPFDAMRQAVSEAKQVQRAVDEQANALADLLDGRLRHVSGYRLKRLKRELARWNANTGEWKQ